MMNTNIALPSVVDELPKLITDEEKQNGKEILKADKVIPISRGSVPVKKKDSPYYQLIPAKILDVLEFIETELELTIPGYCTSRLLQIISTIACHLWPDTEKARLNMTYLRSQVPQAEMYMKGLIELEIVCTDGRAIAGEKSYDYWFAPDYESEFISVPLHDQYLILRLEKLFIKVKKEQIKSVRGHSPQVEYLSLLTIDDAFDDYMKNEWKGTRQEYNVRMASAKRIREKDFRAHRDSTARRLHSNVTFMARDVRKFLRVDGKPLVNIDIKNSQPYLSTILLTTPAKVRKYAKSKNLKSILKSLKIPKSKVIKLYLELVVSGCFYEYLMAEFTKEGFILDTDPIKFREKTKEQVLRILFARNWLPGPEFEIERKARQIFISRFKAVHELFSKLRGHERDGKFEKYGRLAILLQTIESHLVLDVIMKRIYKEMPGVFAVSIHDSILTIDDPQVVDSIENMMAEELKKFTGFRSNLKIERGD